MPTANEFAKFGELYKYNSGSYARTIELIEDHKMASEEDILFAMSVMPSSVEWYINQERKLAIHDGSTPVAEIMGVLFDEKDYDNETLMFAPFNNYGDVIMAVFKDGEALDFRSKVIELRDILLLSKVHK